MKNPKTHDSLFKWLITAFTEDFFAHYFPDIRIGAYTFIDKEFLSKYEALQESLKGDVFVMMEVEIDGELREIVIQIEHQGKRVDVSQRVHEYACYAWLLRKQPVWSIVVYTDDAVWRKPVTDRFWYAFDSKDGKQFHRFDVIKIKTERSRDLTRQHSLLCKMLALKADDRGVNREELVREIYRAAAEMKDALSEEHLLLLEQWVNAYKKVSEPILERIKQEIGMEFIATTISEHIFHEGLLQGKAEGIAEGIAKGEARGEARGEIEGQIKMLDMFHQLGLVSDEQFQLMIQPLRQQLAELTDSE